MAPLRLHGFLSARMGQSAQVQVQVSACSTDLLEFARDRGCHRTWIEAELLRPLLTGGASSEVRVVAGAASFASDPEKLSLLQRCGRVVLPLLREYGATALLKN